MVDPRELHARYESALAELTAPFAFVDLEAFDANADDMLRRAAMGKPIRVASKSIRCRALIDRALEHHDRYRGVLAFTLPEALWLHEHGHHDVLVAYPTTDRGALAELAERDPRTRPIVMVDSRTPEDPRQPRTRLPVRSRGSHRSGAGVHTASAEAGRVVRAVTGPVVWG